MIRRIIHAHKCAECGRLIFTVADIQDVPGGEPIFRHPRCLPQTTPIENNCASTESASENQTNGVSNE
jgi:hypothetical protein